MSEETTTTSSEPVVALNPTTTTVTSETTKEDTEKITSDAAVNEVSNDDDKGNTVVEEVSVPPTAGIGEKRSRDEVNQEEGVTQKTESSSEEVTVINDSTVKEGDSTTTPSTSTDEPPAKRQNVSSDTAATTTTTAAVAESAVLENVVSPKASSGVPSGVPTGVPSEVPVTAAKQDDAIVEEKDTVPTMYVGRVIGKGGEMIRDLQARSGCRIDVDQNVPAGAPRIITYRGSRKTVEFAKQLVSMLCQSSSDRKSNEDQLPLGAATRKHLVVPTSVIGKIIGRGGEMIRELQGKSGAKIQVDHSGAGGVDPTMRQVTVTGTDSSVVKADEMIRFLIANPSMDAMAAIAMLIKDKTNSGNHWGSGPPYPNLPNNGANMVGRDGYGIQNHHNQNNNYGGYNSGASSNNHYQSPPESEIFPCAKMYMGRVIGQKGVTINDLQKRSGCDIQINQDVPPGHDCEITIKGPRQGIETAKSMLTEIIQLGPQHPYAGGQSRQNNNYRNHHNNNNHQQTSYGNHHQPPQQHQPYQQQQQQQQQQQLQTNNYAANYTQQHQHTHQQYVPQQSYAPPAYATNTNNNAYAPNQVYAQQLPPQQHQAPPAAAVAVTPAYSAYTTNYATQPPQQPQTYAPPQQQPQQQQPIPQQQQTQQMPVYYQQQQQQQPPPPYVQPAPQPAPASFPVWKTAQAPDGQTYYYNEKTGETSWDKPPGMP